MSMLSVLNFCVLTFLHLCNAITPGQLYFATTYGEIWPKPLYQNKTSKVFEVDPTNIKFNITGKNCKKIELAVQRCQDYMNYLSNLSKRNFSQDYSSYNVQQEQEQEPFKELQIHLSEECEDYPYIDMNESYNLTVSNTSTLNSSSVWGIIRGMESFTQMFYLTSDLKTMLIKGTEIRDSPNYPHRGLMLDTARHFLAKETILKTLDAMAMNKMNVFHWHIADDESFPYQSTRLPKLSYAAFHSSMVYTKRDLEEVRDYARDLGIRVLIEIEMPNHCSYWEVSYPEILTTCNYDEPLKTRPLNPMNNETYAILKELLLEIQEVFPDNYIHLGGDEVEKGCWAANIDVEKYLIEKDSVNIDIVLDLFYSKVFPLLKNGSIPVIWEDTFQANITLPEKTLIQTWKYDDGSDSMANVLNAGYRGIQSAPYYLNRLDHEMDWFYMNEPRLAVKGKVNDTLLKNVLGGTACMWGEMVDDTNVLSRVWPRTSGLAEVLWSETDGEGLDAMTILRMEEHTCRMRRRGVPAQPAVGFGFCVI